MNIMIQNVAFFFGGGVVLLTTNATASLNEGCFGTRQDEKGERSKYILILRTCSARLKETFLTRSLIEWMQAVLPSCFVDAAHTRKLHYH